MPREILAEDIERFLTTVDGVVSARLLTSPSGDVDQIYITADDATTTSSANGVSGSLPRAARSRSAISLAMSRYRPAWTGGISYCDCKAWGMGHEA